MRNLLFFLGTGLFVGCGAVAPGSADGGTDTGTIADAAVPREASDPRDSSFDAGTGSSVDAAVADAASRDRTCAAEATLRFENCVQETDSDAGFPAIPQVIVASRIGPGSNGSLACPLAEQPGLTVGTYGAAGTPPRPVQNSGTEGGDRVAVACSVIPAPDGSFRVRGEASRTGAGAPGTVKVAGIFRAESAPQPGITLTYQRPGLGTFEQTDCVASYDPDPNAGIAPGRVWFRVTCPKATSPATP